MKKFDFLPTSDKCVKCGKCKPNCTIFAITGDEAKSPRGFLDLLGAYSRGELALDKNAKKIFESCFLCTSCTSVCTNDLPTDEMIENVRADIARKFGIAWYKRAFFYLLRHRSVMDAAARLGYVFQSCGFKLEENGMKARFPMPMVKVERLLPSAKKRSFMNSHPEFVDNGGTRTVGIFIGCMANYAYSEIGEGLLKICAATGFNAHLMKEQACCAAPAYFTGDFATVRANATKNIAYFERILESVEAIVVPEATCAAMIKVDYARFFADEPEWRERAEAVAKKIFMASEFFAKYSNLKEILAAKGRKSELKVAYHDPCHARKVQGVWKEPRALLSEVCELRDPEDSTTCCGFGGVTMQSENYHLSRAAGLRRAAQLTQTNADVASAECSACKMQLNNALNLAGSKMRCKNWAEIVGDAL